MTNEKYQMTNGKYSDQAAKDYRKPDAGSSANQLPAAPAEFRPRRITAVTAPTENFHRPGSAPVKQCISNRNPAAPAKFCTSGITLAAAWTRDCGRRRRDWSCYFI